MPQFVEVTVSGLAVDPNSNMPMVLLTDKQETHTLPIWIGVFEASAIATEMEKIQVERPMTHDLFRNMLDSLRVTLMKIEIHDIRKNTFFANLVLKNKGDEEIRLDCRPSDAIALALRCDSAIFVEKTILESSAHATLTTQLQKAARTKEEWSELLKNLSEDAFGKYKM